MEHKRLETKLERKTTIMKNHELIKLFSKTKKTFDFILTFKYFFNNFTPSGDLNWQE